MERVEAFVATSQEIGAKLDAEDMDPDPEREDLGSGDMPQRVREVCDHVHERLLPALEDALEDLDSEGAGEGAATTAAWILAEVATLCWASGERGQVAPLLDRAIRIAPEGPVKDELLAYLHEPQGMSQVVRARWLQRHGDFAEADRIARQVRSEAKSAVLKESAAKLLATPRPLSSAPSLGTVNGIGFMLYGSRDPDESNGSHVTTRWFTVAFVPVFPMGAYRVIDHRGAAYTFLTKEPLGRGAKAWRWAVPVGVLAALALLGWYDHTSSPEYQAGSDIEAAAEMERAGDLEGALSEYEAAVWRWTGEASAEALEPAAVAVVRLASASVGEPMTHAGVQHATRVVRRFEQLPPDLRRTAASALLAEKLGAWADQIGSGDIQSAQASLRLWTMAEETSEGAGEVSARRTEVQRTLAGLLAADWPLLAIEQYVGLLLDDDAATAAGELIRGVLDHPSLVLDAEDALERWSRHPPPSMAGLSGEVSGVLAAAREMREDPGRRAALDSGDPAALAQVLERYPGDHDAVAALAELERAAGRAELAIARIEAVGPPGRLNGRLQQTLASCYTDAGRVEEAQAILERYVAARMPAFQRAQAMYERVSNDRAYALREQARRGPLPLALDRRLAAAPPDRHQAIFEEWLAEELRDDAQLRRLREEHERHSEVVPAVLSLGTLELRLASAASGDAREAFLAEAERLFLAIRLEAEGVPSFHLGLGQVYYRLGKEDEGERELQSLLARHDDPNLALAVAHAYREIGLLAKAREVAERVYEGGVEPASGQAAVLLALVSDRLEEIEHWLQRAPQDDAFVQNKLLGVRAARLLRDGQLSEAAEVYSQIAVRYEEDADHDQAAANNAALAYQDRYFCTGELADLERSVTGLEAALRMQPDSSVTLGNAAAGQTLYAFVKTLSRFVHTRVLKPDTSDSEFLLNALEDGPLREELIAAFEREPAYRRALELTTQEQVLAPQRTWAWSRERRWLVRRNDGAALRDLAARLARVQSLDTSQDDAHRARWISGEDDEQALRDLTASIEQAETQVRTSRALRHGPTLGAALFLLGDRYLDRSLLTLELADVERGVDAFREAARTWPELNAEHQLASALVVLAMQRVAEGDEERRATLSDLLRRFTSEVCLHELMSDPDWANALRGQPELAEAAGLLREHPRSFPSVGDWVIARAASDDELSETAAAALARPELRVSLELRARLSPTSEDLQRRLALLP